nr:MAG TPA: hypothetical protein [Caudoviricetes sp.]
MRSVRFGGETSTHTFPLIARRMAHRGVNGTARSPAAQNITQRRTIFSMRGSWSFFKIRRLYGLLLF